MKEIALYPPQYIHELGSRSNNEDVIFPKQPSQEDCLFMVCDGVGGQDKGEVAAQLSSHAFHSYFQNNLSLIHI